MRFLIILSFIFLSSCSFGDYRTASRESAKLAPPPSEHKAAIIQAYAAPTFGWRGWFAVHTWISVKAANTNSYTVYEVVGWRLNRGLPALRIENDLPDRYWFGEKPRLLIDIRGEAAQNLVEKIDKAAKTYPWPKYYKAFPGPNSNTFIAWIAKHVPELELKLPFSAIGSGYNLNLKN